MDQLKIAGSFYVFLVILGPGYILNDEFWTSIKHTVYEWGVLILCLQKLLLFFIQWLKNLSCILFTSDKDVFTLCILLSTSFMCIFAHTSWFSSPFIS